jgi:hypothetical protein
MKMEIGAAASDAGTTVKRLARPMEPGEDMTARRIGGSLASAPCFFCRRTWPIIWDD